MPYIKATRSRTIKIPVSEIADEFDPEDVLDAFTVDNFDEYGCSRCPLRKQRLHNDCLDCESYKGRTNLATIARNKKTKRKFINFPLGAQSEIERRMGVKLKLRDKVIMTRRKLKRPIKFTGKLYTGGTSADGTSRANQVKAVNAWLVTKMGVIQAAARAGKCVTGDSYVMSERGFLPIADLFTADHADGEGREVSISVATRNGNRRTSHTYKKSVRKTIKLSLAQGYTLEGTPEHPVRIIDTNGHMVWRRLDKIRVGDNVQMTQGHNGKWPDNTFDPDHAKLLGFLIANGGLSEKKYARITFTSGVTETQREFLRVLTKFTGKEYSFTQHKNKTPEVSIYGPEWRAIQERFDIANGLAADKSIPKCVLSSNREAMLAFLSGYLSCDSHVPATGTLELCSASKTLATQLHLLLQAFGVIGQLSTKDSYARNSNTPTMRTYYRILFSGEGRRKLIDLIDWCKPVPVPNEEVRDTSGKYLITAIPNLRAALKRIARKGKYGWFTINEETVQARLPFVRDKSDKQIARMAFDKTNWSAVLPLIDHYDKELGNTIRELRSTPTNFVSVENVTVNRKKQTVYDLSIPNGREFVANGIVVHNTVMATYISAELGLRTLVIADRVELLRQFRDTFIGNEERGKIAMTDAKPSRVVIIEKMSDFDKPHDVALLNYQKMIRDSGEERVTRHIKNRYGLVILDEAHQAGAEAYSRFLLRLDIPYRLGLTATPRRKDGRYRLVDTIFGPIVARTKNVGLKPLVKVYPTQLFGDSKVRAWHAISNLIAGTDERNRMVIREIFRLLDDGHQAIVVPVDRINHVEELVTRINAVQLNRFRKAGRKGAEAIAIPFTGQTKDRQGVLNEFDKHDSPNRVLVCMRSIIKQGVDLSRPSAVVCPIPMSGKHGIGAPLFGQLSYRASTPYNGKRQPEVILFIDDLEFIQTMTKTLFASEITPSSSLLKGLDNCVYVMHESCKPYAGVHPAKWERQARMEDSRMC